MVQKWRNNLLKIQKNGTEIQQKMAEKLIKKIKKNALTFNGKMTELFFKT